MFLAVVKLLNMFCTSVYSHAFLPDLLLYLMFFSLPQHLESQQLQKFNKNSYCIVFIVH